MSGYHCRMPEAEKPRGFWLVVWDWITTIPTLLLFAVVFVAADLVLRVSRLFGEHAVEVAAGVMQRILILAFLPSGVRLKIERDPEVRKDRPYILVSNHQSFFDVPIIGGVLFSNFPKYIAKKELSKGIPFVSYNLRRGGNAIIDRAAGRDAVRVIREFGKRCQERGVSAVIFPEGSRSRDGHLKEFKPVGAAQLMKAAPDLDIVPTTIDGSWHLLTNKMFPIPFGTVVRISFGRPILREAGQKAEDVVLEVREIIASQLDQWRIEPAT